MLGEPEHASDEINRVLGPPVLLKRLGNLFEGELARDRLHAAGIPSLLNGVDTFHADPNSPRGQVELFVPQSLVADALDVLDATPDETWDDADLPPDDPGRPIAFRAFVTAIVGWLVVFLGPFGVWLAVPTFVFAIVLAVRAIRLSPSADRVTRFQVALAVLFSLVGTGVSIAFVAEMVNHR